MVWSGRAFGAKGNGLVLLLFCDDLGLAGGDEGGVAIVRPYKDDHAKFVSDDGALCHRLPPGVDVDACGAHWQVGADGALAAGTAACRGWGGRWQIGDGVIIGGAGDADGCDPAKGDGLLCNALVVGELEEPRVGRRQ